MKWDVLSSSWVAESLCKPEIDNKCGEALVTETHQDILQLDVTMDITMRVDLLKTRNLKHLRYQSQTQIYRTYQLIGKVCYSRGT